MLYLVNTLYVYNCQSFICYTIKQIPKNCARRDVFMTFLWRFNVVKSFLAFFWQCFWKQKCRCEKSVEKCWYSAFFQHYIMVPLLCVSGHYWEPFLSIKKVTKIKKRIVTQWIRDFQFYNMGEMNDKYVFTHLTST